MPDSSSAISATDRVWLVPRSVPTKPSVFAYAVSDAPTCTEAPSELSMRGSYARPASSISTPRRIASSGLMSHGCQRSSSGNVVASRAGSARPLAGSSSVWRAIAHACSTVCSIDFGSRSAVLAEPLRLPK
jgi:hypothetical protein